MRFKTLTHSFLISVALALLFSCATKDQTINFNHNVKTFEEVLSLLQKESKTGFIYFTLEGCSPCIALQDSVFHNKDAIQFISSNFVPFWFDADSSSTFPFIEQFNLTGYPTIALINESGELLNKVVGYGGTVRHYIERLRAASNPESSIKALRNKSEIDPEDIGETIEYAHMLHKNREFSEASKLYEKLITKVTDKLIYIRLADYYNRTNQDKAIRFLEKGLESNIFGEDTNMVNCRLGNWYYQKGSYPGALLYYKKLPKSVEDFTNFERSSRFIWGNISMIYMWTQYYMPFAYILSGQEEVGEEMLHKKFSDSYEQKDFTNLNNFVGICVAHEVYIDNALSWVIKANEISEWKNRVALEAYIAMLQKVGDYQKSVEIQEIILDVVSEIPVYREIARKDLAVMYSQVEHHDRADSLFGKLVDEAKNDYYEYYQLAKICSENEVNSHKALGWMEKALELSKTKPSQELDGIHLLKNPDLILEIYAELLYQTGNIQKAIEVIYEAIEVTQSENSKRRYQLTLEKYKSTLNS